MKNLILLAFLAVACSGYAQETNSSSKKAAVQDFKSKKLSQREKTFFKNEIHATAPRLSEPKQVSLSLEVFPDNGKPVYPVPQLVFVNEVRASGTKP